MPTLQPLAPYYFVTSDSDGYQLQKLNAPRAIETMTDLLPLGGHPYPIEPMAGSIITGTSSGDSFTYTRVYERVR